MGTWDINPRIVNKEDGNYRKKNVSIVSCSLLVNCFDLCFLILFYCGVKFGTVYGLPLNSTAEVVNRLDSLRALVCSL